MTLAPEEKYGHYYHQSLSQRGRGREDNPNVPWSLQEVAQEAIRCYDAGASIVHFHARRADGSTSYDPEWYTQTDTLIRAQCDLVLNHTTARQDGVPVEKVTKYLLETPLPVEMVSLNLGLWRPVARQPSHREAPHHHLSQQL